MSLRPRMFEIARALIVRGQAPGRWRCSPDLCGELQTMRLLVPVDDSPLGQPTLEVYELRGRWGSWPAGTRLVGPPPSLDGIPIAVDESLPPNSLLLDPA